MVLVDFIIGVWYSICMDKLRFRKIGLPAILLVLFLLLPVSNLSAFSIQSFEWQFEMRRIGVDTSDLEASSAAVWTRALGFKVPFLLGEGPFFLVTGLNLSTLYYYYNTESDYAVVTDVEWRELTTLVPQVDTAVRWVFIEGEKGIYSLETGMGFSFPIPLKAWGDEATSGKIIPNLYSGGSFFLPMVALQASLPVFKDISLLLRFSVHLPLYRTWDGSGLPLSDGLQLGFSIGLD